MKLKVFLFIFCFIGIILLGYIYFLHSFSIIFELNRTPASLFYSIQNLSNSRDDSLKIETLSSKRYNSINQKNNYFTKETFINWKLKTKNDTLTQVKVSYIITNLTYLDKIKLALNQSKYKDFYKKRTELFFNQAQLFKNSYSLKNPKQENSLYIKGYVVSIKTKREDKAMGMIKNIGLLDDFFKNNKLKIEGKPFLKVTKWDRDTDSLKFDFGYPSQSSITGNKIVKKIEYLPQASSSIEYYGNYINSDQAWFYLFKNIESPYLPLEIFYNNPQNGGDDKEWKALIYLQK